MRKATKIVIKIKSICALKGVHICDPEWSQGSLEITVKNHPKEFFCCKITMEIKPNFLYFDGFLPFLQQTQTISPYL